ncbi:4-diphosphocytidyl-2C-methyl-D-erythritol synthase [Roseobacter denitrificans]|nr:nucleotidyltransferase family protein [Roseobacter denitrificans]AVL51721.1 4-diphosphocytidyl-2C-methyl-D-erythritol synthase [Roseobacter denitrificans]
MNMPASSKIPIILLAAGASRRMRGGDKLLEEVDGLPLLRRQTMRAINATKGPVIVTLPPEGHARKEALTGLKVTTVPVPDAAHGMSVSLRRGLAQVPVDAGAVMVLLPDLPDLTTKDLVAVLDAADRTKDALIWRGTTSDGAAGHPIVFARALFAELASISGDTGGASVVARHSDKTSFIRLPGNRARLDLDTPEDWAKWRASQ